MTAASGSNQVSSRYAAALLDMAAEANIVEKIEQDITDLAKMIEASADLRKLIGNPLFGRERQKQAILALAQQAKLQPLTINFLGVLATNSRLPMLSGIIRTFRDELSCRRGELNAKVRTAHALSPEQTKALQEQLGKAMGSHVTLNVEVDRDLLGGMVVTVGSKQIDNSVRNKLDRLKRAMSGKAA